MQRIVLGKIIIKLWYVKGPYPWGMCIVVRVIFLKVLQSQKQLS